MNKEKKFVAVDVVSCRCEDNGVCLLFNPDLNKKTQINQTGKIVWDCIKTPMSLQEIGKHLVNNFDVSLKQAQKDVQEFLTCLMPQYVEEVNR